MYLNSGHHSISKLPIPSQTAKSQTPRTHTIDTSVCPLNHQPTHPSVHPFIYSPIHPLCANDNHCYHRTLNFLPGLLCLSGIAVTGVVYSTPFILPSFHPLGYFRSLSNMHAQYLHPRGLLYPHVQLLSFLDALFPARIDIFRVPQPLLCFPRLSLTCWVSFGPCTLPTVACLLLLCPRLVSGPSESKSPVPRIATVLWMSKAIASLVSYSWIPPQPPSSARTFHLASWVISACELKSWSLQ